MARSDLKHVPPSEVFSTILKQLVDAHSHYQGFGETANKSCFCFATVIQAWKNQSRCPLTHD